MQRPVGFELEIGMEDDDPIMDYLARAQTYLRAVELEQESWRMTQACLDGLCGRPPEPKSPVVRRLLGIPPSSPETSDGRNLVVPVNPE